ncbi:unnamed protein product [Cutaneotrichosporon oleaginosum]
MRPRRPTFDHSPRPRNLQDSSGLSDKVKVRYEDRRGAPKAASALLPEVRDHDTQQWEDGAAERRRRTRAEVGARPAARVGSCPRGSKLETSPGDPGASDWADVPLPNWGWRDDEF